MLANLDDSLHDDKLMIFKRGVFNDDFEDFFKMGRNPSPAFEV